MWCDPTRSSFRQPGYLAGEVRGFAPPPLGRFAFSWTLALYHATYIARNIYLKTQELCKVALLDQRKALSLALFAGWL